MKTIFMLIIYMISMLGGNINNSNSTPNIRYDVGVVTDCFYFEATNDYNVTFVTPSDGNEWIIENFSGNVGDTIIVEFDTMNTPDDIYDDSITGVISFSQIY